MGFRHIFHENNFIARLIFYIKTSLRIVITSIYIIRGVSLRHTSKISFFKPQIIAAKCMFEIKRSYVKLYQKQKERGIRRKSNVKILAKFLRRKKPVCLKLPYLTISTVKKN